MTPLEYEYLRKLLKERSGLDLSADKQYLVESRLIPLARKASLNGITELVQKIKGGAEGVTVDVIEAMTTNETFFFRDKIPFDHLRQTVLPELLQARASRRMVLEHCAATGALTLPGHVGAPFAGRIVRVDCREGQQVAAGDLLLELDAGSG